MICDHGRFAYKQRCQFFSDGGPVLTISWYRAPPGAKFLPIPSRFRSLLWDSFPWSLTGPGEVWGKAPAWQPGSTPPTAHGVGFFGAASSFAQGQHYDPAGPHYPRDPFGLAIACSGFALGQGGGLQLAAGLVGHGTEARAGMVLSAGRTGPDFRGIGGLLLGAGTSGPNVRVGGGELLGAGLVGDGELLGGGELLGAGTGEPLPSGLLLGGGGDRGDGPTGGGLLLSAGVDVPPRTGLELWLDANDLAGVGEGNPVSTWPDRSGNANDAVQPTPGSQPTWTALHPTAAAAVDFGFGFGITMPLTTAICTGTAMSLYVVLAHRFGNESMLVIGGDLAHLTTLIDQNGPTPATTVQCAGGSGFIVPPNTGTDAALVSLRRSGTAGHLARNDFSPGSSNITLGAGASMLDRLAGTDFAVGLSVGFLCEVIAYGRLVSSEEDAQITLYLANKWGITV